MTTVVSPGAAWCPILRRLDFSRGPLRRRGLPGGRKCGAQLGRHGCDAEGPPPERLRGAGRLPRKNGTESRCRG